MAAQSILYSRWPVVESGLFSRNFKRGNCSGELNRSFCIFLNGATTSESARESKLKTILLLPTDYLQGQFTLAVAWNISLRFFFKLPMVRKLRELGGKSIRYGERVGCVIRPQKNLPKPSDIHGTFPIPIQLLPENELLSESPLSPRVFIDRNS